MSVNIGTIQELPRRGEPVATGIIKTPTDQVQQVRGVNIGDDRQADLAAHGGVDKAIYAYAIEDYRWWAETLGRETHPGLFGENLTTEGIDVSEARVGDRWSIGSTLLEVSEPRLPCFKLSLRTQIPRIVKRFAEAARPGCYLRIIDEGELVVGDAVRVRPTAGVAVSMRDISRTYFGDKSRAAQMVALPALSEAWREWARAALAKGQ
ncbi:MAG: MOSC domain-containing protein [Actinomycetia bacterium]|nr:MOSC domain-containing protein [Actinomycetes bacterium]